jgi:hypothetical protein
MRALTEAQREKNKAVCKAWHKANREVACARSKKWRLDNPERKRANDVAWQRANTRRIRHSKLQRKFGISIEQYETMLHEQGGVCFLCDGVNENGRQLGVDHNHSTGGIRKLLCIHCNTAIERLDTIPHWAQKADTYIRSHQ